MSTEVYQQIDRVNNANYDSYWNLPNGVAQVNGHYLQYEITVSRDQRAEREEFGGTN